MHRRGDLLVAAGLLLAAVVGGVAVVHRHGSADGPERALHLEVVLPYGPVQFPDGDAFDALAATDDDLAAGVEETGLGEWEGQSVGDGTYDVGLLVDDEAAALRLVRRVLQEHGRTRGAVVEVTRNDEAGTPVRTVRL